MILDKNKIYEYQQNREPYLMIDFVTEVVPGQSSKGYKDFFENEWFFKVHWPKDPNVPGMLQIEALVQMASMSILTMPNNKGKIMYLINANNLKFLKKIVPNDRMCISTTVKSYKRGLAIFEGEGLVNNQIVCQANFSLVLPDELKRYNLQQK
jgi:3-hydroxyacyl-[acyl-carrier-protein] dehydratase